MRRWMVGERAATGRREWYASASRPCASVRVSRRFRGRFTLAGRQVDLPPAGHPGRPGGRARRGSATSRPAADCASTLRCLAALGVDGARATGPRSSIDGRGPEAWTRRAGPSTRATRARRCACWPGVLAGRPFRSRARPATPRCAAGRWSAWRRRCGRWARASRRTDGRPPLTIEGGAARAASTWSLPVRERAGEDGGPPGRAAGGGHDDRARARSRAATTPSGCCRSSACARRARRAPRCPSTAGQPARVLDGRARATSPAPRSWWWPRCILPDSRGAHRAACC